MMIWVILLAIFALIATIPLGATVRYDSDGICVRIIASFLRFAIYPMKRKPKDSSASEKKPSQSKKTKKNKDVKEPKEASKGGNFADFIPLIRIGLDFLNSFRKKLCVNHLELKLILAGEDPCDLAVQYGRIWAAVDNLLPMLERVLVIQKRDIEVECDFATDKTLVIAQLDLTVTIGRLFAMMVKYGYLVLRELLIIKKKRKGGAAA